MYIPQICRTRSLYDPPAYLQLRPTSSPMIIVARTNSTDFHRQIASPTENPPPSALLHTLSSFLLSRAPTAKHPPHRPNTTFLLPSYRCSNLFFCRCRSTSALFLSFLLPVQLPLRPRWTRLPCKLFLKPLNPVNRPSILARQGP